MAPTVYFTGSGGLAFLPSQYDIVHQSSLETEGYYLSWPTTAGTVYFVFLKENTDGPPGVVSLFTHILARVAWQLSSDSSEGCVYNI